MAMETLKSFAFYFLLQQTEDEFSLVLNNIKVKLKIEREISTLKNMEVVENKVKQKTPKSITIFWHHTLWHIQSWRQDFIIQVVTSIQKPPQPTPEFVDRIVFFTLNFFFFIKCSQRKKLLRNVGT